MWVPRKPTFGVSLVRDPPVMLLAGNFLGQSTKVFPVVDKHEALLSKWGTWVEMVQNVNGDLYC